MDLFGLQLVAHPLLKDFRIPVLKIREDVPCSEPTRSMVNAYLLATFGENEVAIITGNTAYLSPENTALLLMRAKS